ncbi:MAG: CocE/NonD family hydrolase [Novipirellula sp. JB048]
MGPRATKLRSRYRWALAMLLVVTSSVIARAADYVVQHDIMVEMRDGVRLATDVYRPAVDDQPIDQALPVILSRTPYNKAGGKTMGAYYATHGYVFVAQDTRGRYGSEGVWHMLTDDGPDGVDCAAWIGNQPWSNGKIGMIGTSYFGGTQHAMALAGAPELTTVIPVDAMANMGRQSIRNAVPLNSGSGTGSS